MKILFVFLALLVSLNLYAEKGIVTGLDIPRFVSLKSNEINLRVGPSKNYPILLKYVQKNLPIEIIDELDAWRKSRDYEGNIGWIHKSLIKGERFVIVKHNTKKNGDLYNIPNGKITGLIKKNNILNLSICIVDWCKVSHNNFTGWMLKKNIWGVYETEIYNLKFYQPIVNQYWKILNSKFFN